MEKATELVRPERSFECFIINVNKKTWLAKCYHKASSHGLAGSSWKNFALENFIEKDDACVFNLVSQSDSAVIFKVSIFQVVQEVVALNRLAGTTSRKSMQPTNTPYEQLQTGFKCNEGVLRFCTNFNPLMFCSYI